MLEEQDIQRIESLFQRIISESLTNVINKIEETKSSLIQKAESTEAKLDALDTKSSEIIDKITEFITSSEGFINSVNVANEGISDLANTIGDLETSLIELQKCCNSLLSEISYTGDMLVSTNGMLTRVPEYCDSIISSNAKIQSCEQKISNVTSLIEKYIADVRVECIKYFEASSELEDIMSSSSDLIESLNMLSGQLDSKLENISVKVDSLQDGLSTLGTLASSLLSNVRFEDRVNSITEAVKDAAVAALSVKHLVKKEKSL